MSTTFGELKTRASTVLQDPSRRTFTEGLVEELVQEALVEVSRIAPEQFTEDITPVANSITYALRSSEFAGEAVPEIELTRVEIWNGDTAPEQYIASVIKAATQPENGFGDRGWYVWNGTLYLPTRTVNGLIGHESDYLIRVWGYSPYVTPNSDNDVIGVSKEVEQAMVWYIRVAALELLMASRDLFTQWQTRSGNTDMSPAGLMNQKSIAEAQWARRSKAITRLRSEF